MQKTTLLQAIGAATLTTLFAGGAALASVVLPPADPVTVTEYVFPLDEGGPSLLLFDVANNGEGNGVWSILIGAEPPPGIPDAGEANPAWSAELLYIYDIEGSYLAFADGATEPLFILNSDWANYDTGYYYSTSTDPIALGDSKTFAAYTGYPGSPFVYTTSPPEPSNNTPSGSGWTTSPVPEPATVLLFGSGLVGLAGIGRSPRKQKAA